MEPTPAYESPFKKNEPVTGSLKWMLLTALALAGWIYLVTAAYVEQFDVSDLVYLLANVGLLVATGYFLCRAIWKAGSCRGHRSFERMAHAVRAQRPWWMIFIVVAGVTSGLFIVRALQWRATVERLGKAAEERRQFEKQQQSRQHPQP